MPAPKGNTNAQRGEAPLESNIQMRCLREQKARYVQAAQRAQIDGKKDLTTWLLHVADEAAAKVLGD